MPFITMVEATKIAQDMRIVPEAFIEDAKNKIINALANNSTSITISKPISMSQPQWIGFQNVLRANGWTFKPESCQREGQWVVIEMPQL